MLRLKPQACLGCLSHQLQGLSVMPDARGAPIVGAIDSIIKSDGGARLHEYIDAQHRKHGPLFRGQVGPLRAVFVSDPDAIRRVYSLEGSVPLNFVPEAWTLYNDMRKRTRGLLFMNGEEWQTNRRILNKILLAPDTLSYMSEPCSKAASDLVESWKKYSDGQVVPNVESQLYQWSIEVILATLAGKSWSAYRPSVLAEVETLSRRLIQIFDYSVELARLPARLAAALRLSSWRGFVETADHCFASVDKLAGGLAELRSSDGLLARMAEQGLGQDALRRIAVDFVFAAGDTTAFALQWLFYLLASNPEAQQRLYESLAGLDREQLPRQPLLRAAIKETLRLYPIAPFITRVMPNSNYLGRYLIDKGELVVMSVYSCSRSEESFPRPNEFWPERWLRNEQGGLKAVNNANASLPFSMGAKSCIGKKLAEIQLSYAAAELLKNFEIDCLNKESISIKLRLITAPSEPLQLRLTPRK